MPSTPSALHSRRRYGPAPAARAASIFSVVSLARPNTNRPTWIAASSNQVARNAHSRSAKVETIATVTPPSAAPIGIMPQAKNR